MKQTTGEVFTYTKEELIACTLAFNKLSLEIIEHPGEHVGHILAIAEFHQELRKIIPNTLWK